MGDLRVHMKTCHTKPSLESPKRNKSLKLSDATSPNMFMIEMENQSVEMKELGNNDKKIEIQCNPIHRNEKSEPMLVEVQDLITCNLCEYDTTDQNDLDNHLNIIHGQHLEVKSSPEKQTESKKCIAFNKSEEKSFKCGICGVTFESENECQKHMTDHTNHKSIACESCELVTEDVDMLKVHRQIKHMSSKVDLRAEDQRVISCDQCGYKCKYNIQLKKHLTNTHQTKKHYCKTCDYSTDFIASTWEHTLNAHPEQGDEFSPKDKENLILKIVAEQTTSMSDDLLTLKKDSKDAFTEITLACENMKKVQKINDDKCISLGNLIAKLVNKVSRMEKALSSYQKKAKHVRKKSDPVKNIKSEPVKNIKTEPVKNVKNESKDKEAKKSPVIPPSVPKIYPENLPSNPEHSKLTRKTPFLNQAKTLFVGDSVGHTGNLRIVERASGCRIRSTRAYSSHHDVNARWPDKNFRKVVRENLTNPGSEDYEVLVMSAPTVDISNLDTNMTSNNSTESLEQKVIESSKNMFNIATEALSNNKSLRKVVIIEHPPRFDDNIKSKLADLANNTTNQLWAISPLKDKIFIGRHSLVSPGTGSTHLARYKDYTTGRYDGVHLYGKTGVKDYTDSMKSIMVMALMPNILNTETVRDNSLGAADHTTCEQAVYQQWRMSQRRRQHRQGSSTAQQRYGTQYSHHTRVGQSEWAIPVANRFAPFYQGN